MNKFKVLSALAAISLMIPAAYASTMDQLDATDLLLETQDYYPTGDDDLYDNLQDSSSRTESMYFSQGENYTVAAVCDIDCTDVDLWVYDKYGNLVDSDDDETDVAIVHFRATYDGPYDLKVKMYDCDASYCYYRVRSYIRIED